MRTKIAVVSLVLLAAGAAYSASGGFDEFGYNYRARIFNGAADGVDRNLDGTFWGDPTYAKDHLVMKWTSEWNRGKDENWANPPYADAWTSNEWNGRPDGGSGETWHYKIVWVGTSLGASEYWRPGGYPIWGQFEVVFSHGTAPNAHFWDAHASPPGYGWNTGN